MYVNFGNENLIALAFVDKTQGSKSHQKEPYVHQNTISGHTSNYSLIGEAILNQFMLGEIFLSPKLVELQICTCSF
jgi:hypothetical protein